MNLTGLSVNTTYYYRVVAGTATGSILSFKTLAVQSTPSVTTTAASGISLTGATLNGTINPNLTAVNAIQFIYGTNSALSSGTTTVTLDDGTGLAVTATGSSLQPFSTTISGLTGGTTYYFKIRGCTTTSSTSASSLTCSATVDGSILSFVAMGAPTVTTNAATSVGSSIATLNGTITANYATTSASFIYSTVSDLSSGTTTVSAGSVTGSSATSVSANIIGLSPSTKYYFRATGVNSIGTANGSALTFTTTSVNRTITINGASYSSTYSFSATPPTLTSTVSDGGGTKTYSSFTTSVCTIDSSTGTVTFLDAGTCTLGVAISAADGYTDASSPTISFTITALSRTLTINGGSYASSYVISDNPPTITSTASAGGGTKSYSSSTTPVCTIDSASGLVSFVDVGTCTITAAITGSGGYASATSPSISFSVTAVPVATSTPTLTPTVTLTPTPTATSTPIPTATLTPTPTVTSTPTPTAVSSPTPTPTSTLTPTPTYTVTPTPNLAAPVISNISATRTATSATITWDTDLSSSSQIEYGLVPSYGFTTAEIDTSPRLSNHSVSLSNLKACARYFYRTVSTSSTGSIGVSLRQSFKTPGCPTSSVVGGVEGSINHNEGGNLHLSDSTHNAQLTIPSNFASKNSSFQINTMDTSSAATTPSGKHLIGEYLYDLIAVDTDDSQLTTFANSVTFSVTYDTTVASGYDESTFDIYTYNGGTWSPVGCTVNTSSHTLTCTLSHFSVYALLGEFSSPTSTPTPTPTVNLSVTPSPTSVLSATPSPSLIPSVTPTGTSTISSISTSSTPSSSCNDQKPSSAPDLFQVSTSPITATLYFTPVNPVTHYVINYGAGTNTDQYSTSFDYGSSTGVMSYTVNGLSPNTQYIFKVRAGNGCTAGDWSANKIATTTGYSTSPVNITSDISTLVDTLQKSLPLTEKKMEVVKKKQTSTYSSAQGCLYTVEQGDSLWGIADKKLGDGSKYQTIIEQNSAIYPSIASGVKVGWELHLNCPQSVPPKKNSAKGLGYEIKVKLQQNGKPIVGAIVELHSIPMRSVTDKDGIARFANVLGGNHTLAFSYKGYSGEQKVTVEGDKKDVTINISVQLKSNEFVSKPLWGIIGLLLFIIFILLFKRRKKKDKDT